MDKYKIKDMEIINAILNHTTGKPAMTLLEKIVFVADYIEPRRDKAPNLPESAVWHLKIWTVPYGLLWKIRFLILRRRAAPLMR